MPKLRWSKRRWRPRAGVKMSFREKNNIFHAKIQVEVTRLGEKKQVWPFPNNAGGMHTYLVLNKTLVVRVAAEAPMPVRMVLAAATRTVIHAYGRLAGRAYAG